MQSSSPDVRYSSFLIYGNSFSVENGNICWIEDQAEKILCSHTDPDINNVIFWDFEGIFHPISIEVLGDSFCVLTSRYSVICNKTPNFLSFEQNSYSNDEGWEVDFSDSPIKKLVRSSDDYCAITFVGEIGCWSPESLVYGDSGSSQKILPKIVYSSQIPAISLSVGAKSFCAILADNSAMCDSIDSHEEALLDKKILHSRLPKTISQIAFSSTEFCILNMSGTVACASYSQLSYVNETSELNSETIFSPWLEATFSISSSDDDICVVTLNGSFVCRERPFTNLLNLGRSPISLSKDIVCFVQTGGNQLSCFEISGTKLSELGIEYPTTSPIHDSDQDGVVDSLDYYPNDKSSSIVCPKGYFGQHECKKADQGYFSPSRNLFHAIPCSLGEYQNLVGSNECKISPPGTFSDKFAMVAPTQCPAGTYSPEWGKSDSTCIDTSPGNWTEQGSSNQIPCPLGTFQPSYGQSKCLVSESGFYVSEIGQKKQTSCMAGSFQPLVGQSTCLLSNPGYFVSDPASIAEQACPPGSFSNLSGAITELSCVLSEPGNFVESPGSFFQSECPAGTYNPNYGSISVFSCEISPPGHFSLMGSSNPELCPPGTYQPSEGQSSCIVSEIGNFSSFGSIIATPCPQNYSTVEAGSTSISDCVSSPGYYQYDDSPLPCPIGTFQPFAGQGDCIDANPGHFVQYPGSDSEEPCPIGTWNQNTASQSKENCTPCPQNYSTVEAGSTSISDCVSSPGYYQYDDSPLPCPIGTFQPFAGQGDCIDANPGHFVQYPGSDSEEPCPIGTYNPVSGSNSPFSCIVVSEGAFSGEGSPNQTFSSPGFFVNGENLGVQIPCPAGTYNPQEGSYSVGDCLDVPEGSYAIEGSYQPSIASAGYYVPQGINYTQVPCPAGTYNPTLGSTNAESCILAEKGYYVENEGSPSQIACPAGTYNNKTGQNSSDSCLETPRGHFSPPASILPVRCPLGEYQDRPSSYSCSLSPPGHYVNFEGAIFPTPCGVGTFQPDNASTMCIDASPGFMVPEPSMTKEIPCSIGFFQPNFGSEKCDEAEPGYYSPLPGAAEQTPCPRGTFQIYPAQSSCEPPSNGYFLIRGISNSQYPCPPGSYSNTGFGELAFSCHLSPIGFSSPGGIPNPLPCEIGSFSEIIGSAICSEAKPGHYVDEGASSQQKECSIGYFQDEPGSSSCKEAPVGFFVDNPGSVEPTPCPTNSFNSRNASTSTSCTMDSDLDGTPDQIDSFAHLSFDMEKSSILLLYFIINSLLWIILQSQINWRKR